MRSTEHFAHVPRLLEALARRVRVAAIVERGEPIAVPGVEPVIVLEHGHGRNARRFLDLARAAHAIRRRGFDTFFLRYSRIAALTLLATRPFAKHRILYWSSGQADMPNPDGAKRSLLDRANGWLNGFVLRRVDTVVTGPETMVDYMCKRWRVKPDRVALLYNDIDVTRFAPADDETRRRGRAERGWNNDDCVVLMVHRLAYRRGSRRLVPIVEQLVERGVDHVRMVVIGDGPDRDFIEKQAAESATARGRIELTGPVPNVELPDWYRAADVFLMPSYEEGFPRVLLEAMATGLPIATTAAGGARDVVGPEYPYTVDVADTDRLVDALTKLCNTSIEERVSLGQRLRQRAEDVFATERVADALAKLLQR
jgi:glycosyltransferase involved in cell wall biosynthesis